MKTTTMLSCLLGTMLAACGGGVVANSGVPAAIPPQQPFAAQLFASGGPCGADASANIWPGAACVPFAASAPFNMQLPASPRKRSDSTAIIANTFGIAPARFAPLAVGLSSESLDYYHPIYFSQPTDPLFTVHCSEPWGRCDLEGAAVRIPLQARPAGGTDHHMTVIDRSKGSEYDFWLASTPDRTAGTITIGWGGTFDLSGPGMAATAGAATAAGFAEWEGLIRAQEVAAGRIAHALVMVVPCSSGHFVYPAIHADHPCALALGAIDSGARVQLAMTDGEIDATGAPAYKRVIWKALAHYGAFVGDTGGNGVAFQVESALTYTTFGAIDPWLLLARSNGVPFVNDRYNVDLNIPGIDLKARLRIIDPCVTQGSC